MIVEKVKKLVDQGKIETALDLIDKKVTDKGNKEWSELILKKIHILEMKGKPEEGLCILHNYIDQVTDENIIFHFKLTKSNILSKLDKKEDGLLILNRLKSEFDFQQLDPYLIGKYHTMKGIILYKLGEYIKSIDISEQGIKYCIENNLEFRKLSLWDNIATVYLFQGKFDQAVDYFKKAISYFETNPPNLTYQAVLSMNIGRSYYYKGDLIPLSNT